MRAISVPRLFLLVALLAAGASLATAGAPEITFQPGGQAAILGGRAIFTVIASGDGPLSYRWRKDGVDLSDGPGVSGATSDALILSDVRFGEAGDYSVVVSNGQGDDTSVEAGLAVNLPQGGDVDVSFDPGSAINDTIEVTLVQPDGRILIGGTFTTVRGAVRGRIARLNADGTTDHTFMNGMIGASSGVYSAALQPDGKVLIGGEFGTVNGLNRGSVARLEADGSLDTTFQNGMTGTNSRVEAIALQPDGKVVIGGWFTTVNGISRNHIARLNADGSLDTMFQNGMAGTNGWAVVSLVLQNDGKVLIAGGFTTVNGVNRNLVARLEADGSLDTTFQNGMLGAGGGVRSMALQPDGKVVLGGSMTVVIGGTTRHAIARLNTNGSLDTTFQNQMLGADDQIESVALQPDGRVVIGGWFQTPARNRIARLQTNGGLDNAFQNGMSGANSGVFSVALQPDGKVLIAGSFSTVNGVSRNRLARLESDGSLDTTLPAAGGGVDDVVRCIALQPDARVLIGGGFAQVGGMSRNRIARLNPDGSLDTTFQSWLGVTGGSVYSLAVQPDGKVLIAGTFTLFNGMSRGIVRLSADGSLDTNFQDGTSNGGVHSLALQPDGKVLVGGSFGTFNGVSRKYIARLEADGSLDTTFQNGMGGADGPVRSVALQPDGRVLIGGTFTTVNGVSRNRLARLEADGSLDTTFQNGMAGASDDISAVSQPGDGRVLIAGSFSTVNGVSRNRLARLEADGSLDTTFVSEIDGEFTVESIALQPDGRVLIGGTFTTVNGVSRNRLARLEADGSLDTTFLNGMSGLDDNLSIVRSVALQPDGRVLIGGQFSQVNGQLPSHAARLHGSTPVAPTLAGQPMEQDSYVGCCAVFHVSATGTPLDYRWRKDGVEIGDGGNIRGAVSATLTLTGLSQIDAGAYSVVVTNVLNANTSDPATLSVDPVPQCKAAACDPVQGCVLSDLADGASCDDANACTGVDACASGACQGGAVVLPAEVTGLQIAADGSTLTWSSVSGTAHDVLRGALMELPVGLGASETCLAADVVGSSTVDAEAPEQGQAFFYVVRGRNACGSGTYGSQSDGTERTSLVCP